MSTGFATARRRLLQMSIRAHSAMSRFPLTKLVLHQYTVLPLLTRQYLALRWRFTPYERMAERIPNSGTILDLGCGHGLFSITLALQTSRRHIIAVDHDENRILSAKSAATAVPNLEFRSVDLLTALRSMEGPLAAVSILDTIHYLLPQHQEELVRLAYERLSKGGVLLVRDVDPGNGFVSVCNQAYERLMTGIGFTRGHHLHFRKAEEWKELFQSHGFGVTSEMCAKFPFADRLFVCLKS